MVRIFMAWAGLGGESREDEEGRWRQVGPVGVKLPFSVLDQEEKHLFKGSWEMRGQKAVLYLAVGYE